MSDSKAQIADNSSDGQQEQGPEGHSMPLIEHLMELRNRLLWSIVALVIGFVLCYIVSEEIYRFLVQPLADLFPHT